MTDTGDLATFCAASMLVTRRALAAACNVHIATVQKWTDGTYTPPPGAWEALTALLRAQATESAAMADRLSQIKPPPQRQPGRKKAKVTQMAQHQIAMDALRQISASMCISPALQDAARMALRRIEGEENRGSE